MRIADMQLDFVPVDTPLYPMPWTTRRPGRLNVVEENDRYVVYTNPSGLQFTLLK